jgi:hypothetical protein
MTTNGGGGNGETDFDIAFMLVFLISGFMLCAMVCLKPQRLGSELEDHMLSSPGESDVVALPAKQRCKNLYKWCRNSRFFICCCVLMVTAIATLSWYANLIKGRCEPLRCPPGSQLGQSLVVALATIDSSQAQQCKPLQVCSFADMEAGGGTHAILDNQALSITGSLSAGQGGPRLWARFEVVGRLYLTALQMRDQSVAPKNGNDPLQGAAARVFRGGRLVARSVSFLRLTTTAYGGAIFVDGAHNTKDGAYDVASYDGSAGVAEFYGCIFDGNQATNACGHDPMVPSGNGGALYFDPGATGILAGCVFRNNRAGCVAGAIFTDSENTQQPYKTSVTISNATFTNNHALGGATLIYGGVGNNFYVWRENGLGRVPCPGGHGCAAFGGTTRCCVDGDHSSFNYVIPNA